MTRRQPRLRARSRPAVDEDIIALGPRQSVRRRLPPGGRQAGDIGQAGGRVESDAPDAPGTG